MNILISAIACLSINVVYAATQTAKDNSNVGQEIRKNKEVNPLYDTKEHQTALSQTIEIGRDPNGNPLLLKACRELGIICGIELDLEMSESLRKHTQHYNTLDSLLKATLAGKAELNWRAPKYTSRPDRVLTVRPLKRLTRLDRMIVWDLGASGGAKWDTTKVGRLINLTVERPASVRRVSGIANEKPVRMSALDALNHIAVATETSWQVVYSDVSKSWKLSIYPDKQ